MDSTEDEGLPLDGVPPSVSKHLHGPVRPVLAQLNSETDLRLADERILDVEERWLLGSQGHQGWPGGNSH